MALITSDYNSNNKVPTLSMDKELEQFFSYLKANSFQFKETVFNGYDCITNNEAAKFEHILEEYTQHKKQL